MRALIFGRGYIGNQYYNSEDFAGSLLSDADITKYDQAEKAIKEFKPEVIINTAGKTNLEWCRDNKTEALLVNVAGPLSLLNLAKQYNIFLVHLSSGCIFEGQGENSHGFKETDKPNPQCFYAQSKAWCDQLISQSDYENVLILRLRQPFSDFDHPRNTITKLIGYDKLITSQQSITYVPDLISATNCLLQKGAKGIFNICNEGTMSPFEIVSLAKKILKLDKTFIPIDKQTLDNMDKNNQREHRVDTLLNTDKLKKVGCQLPQIKQRVEEALIKLAQVAD